MKPKDMSDEQLQLRVAELLEWTNIRIGVCFTVLCGTAPRKSKYHRRKWIPIPDYPNDLNACHEVYLSLDPLKQHAFKCALGRIFERGYGQPGAEADVDYGYFDGQCATARQRCIAFVEVMERT